MAIFNSYVKLPVNHMISCLHFNFELGGEGLLTSHTSASISGADASSSCLGWWFRLARWEQTIPSRFFWWFIGAKIPQLGWYVKWTPNVCFLDLVSWVYRVMRLQKHLSHQNFRHCRLVMIGGYRFYTTPIFGDCDTPSFNRDIYGYESKYKVWIKARTHTRSIPPDPYLDPYPVVLHDPYPWSINTPDPYPWSIPLIHTPFLLKKGWCWP